MMKEYWFCQMPLLYLTRWLCGFCFSVCLNGRLFLNYHCSTISDHGGLSFCCIFRFSMQAFYENDLYLYLYEILVYNSLLYVYMCVICLCICVYCIWCTVYVNVHAMCMVSNVCVCVYMSRCVCMHVYECVCICIRGCGSGFSFQLLPGTVVGRAKDTMSLPHR